MCEVLFQPSFIGKEARAGTGRSCRRGIGVLSLPLPLSSVWGTFSVRAAGSLAERGLPFGVPWTGLEASGIHDTSFQTIMKSRAGARDVLVCCRNGHGVASGPSAGACFVERLRA